MLKETKNAIKFFMTFTLKIKRRHLFESERDIREREGQREGEKEMEEKGRSGVRETASIHFNSS